MTFFSIAAPGHGHAVTPLETERPGRSAGDRTSQSGLEELFINILNLNNFFPLYKHYYNPFFCSFPYREFFLFLSDKSINVTAHISRLQLAVCSMKDCTIPLSNIQRDHWV